MEEKITELEDSNMNHPVSPRYITLVNKSLLYENNNLTHLAFRCSEERSLKTAAHPIQDPLNGWRSTVI